MNAPLVVAPRGAGQELDQYIDGIVHEWSRALVTLGITLIPLFFILDVFMMPRELLPRFGVYRALTVALVIAQFAVLRLTRAGPRAYLHGYFFSIIVGLMIALMTTDLGGFSSTYYAGLNLVLIAVNLLLPWAAIHSAINSAILIGLYVGLNLIAPQAEPVQAEILINNIYFLASTAVIAVSINHVKQKLITQEFWLRADLKAARDALWGEMAVAKRIQTALLPNTRDVPGYQLAAIMLPAEEVGGDYYDVIETAHGETWLGIGDVSGHGVESGLIMMMAQTSILASVNRTPGLKPSKVLADANAVLKKNIGRLGADRYMTCTAVHLREGELVHSGRHLEILIYRARSGTVEVVNTQGVWLGLVDEIDGLLTDDRRSIEPEDVILLYTDGITEAMNQSRELFGEERLRAALAHNARLEVEVIVERIVGEVTAFMHRQRDDLTVVAIKANPRELP